MELYLLRHGASTANELHLVCGASDYPLSEKGVAQAALACGYLSRIPFSRIYTSPLSRATGTIATLESAVAPVVQDALVELNTGTVSHLTLDALWQQDARYRKPWLTPTLLYPGGECMNDMVARIGGWFKANITAWGPDEKILIVGHEGTLRVILHTLLANDIADYPDFPIGNCDHLLISLDQGGAVDFRHVALSSYR